MTVNESAPKVSVCMVTYNQERYIAQAIESILEQQTNFDVEIVIGEDCSTDATRSIVVDLARRHPGRIRPLLNETNLGPKPNFMQTFEACRGQYMAILEGDDYWTSPHKLQMQVDALDAHPNWAMCFHTAQMIYDDWQQAPTLWPGEWNQEETTIVELFDSDFIPTSGVLFRNRLFGRFPDWFAKLFIGDWPLHILNAQYGNIGFVPGVMSVYRVHGQGCWSRLDLTTQTKMALDVLAALQGHFQGEYQEHIEASRLKICQRLIDQLQTSKAACEQLQSQVQFLQATCDSQERSLRAIAERKRKRLWSRIRRELRRTTQQLLNVSSTRRHEEIRAA
jgi:glycosyltransferase involved in cell wall biosynthesis